MIEKRFEQIKSVHEIAPVFLKNEGRIEALFTLYFLALLVQAHHRARAAPCHEARQHRRAAALSRAAPAARVPPPNTVLRLFSLAERHQLLQDGKIVQVFDVQLTDLQHLVLKLLGVLAVTPFGYPSQIHPKLRPRPAESRSCVRRVAAKLDQAGFVRMQRKRKLL